MQAGRLPGGVYCSVAACLLALGLVGRAAVTDDWPAGLSAPALAIITAGQRRRLSWSWRSKRRAPPPVHSITSLFDTAAHTASTSDKPQRRAELDGPGVRRRSSFSERTARKSWPRYATRRLPPAVHRPQSTAHQPTTNNHRPTTNNHRPTTNNHRLPPTVHRPPSALRSLPSTVYRPW